LTLPNAITEFSALPAQRMRLIYRGVLKQGMWTDGVVFNPATIHDKTTFEKPNELSPGMEFVLDFVLVKRAPVAVSVIGGGKMTGALRGKVLHGPGYVP
jgi:N-acyl-D-amino-acid deacylase